MDGRAVNSLSCRLVPLLPNVNRNSAAAEVASMGIEAAGEWGLAATAAALRVEAVVEDLIPVADDERLAAGGARGGVAIDVVDVADVDVLQTGPQRDVASAAQGGVRGSRHIGHAVVRMEGRKVQRYVGTQRRRHPVREPR